MWRLCAGRQLTAELVVPQTMLPVLSLEGCPTGCLVGGCPICRSSGPYLPVVQQVILLVVGMVILSWPVIDHLTRRSSCPTCRLSYPWTRPATDSAGSRRRQCRSRLDGINAGNNGSIHGQGLPKLSLAMIKVWGRQDQSRTAPQPRVVPSHPLVAPSSPPVALLCLPPTHPALTSGFLSCLSTAPSYLPIVPPYYHAI